MGLLWVGVGGQAWEVEQRRVRGEDAGSCDRQTVPCRQGQQCWYPKYGAPVAAHSGHCCLLPSPTTTGRRKPLCTCMSLHRLSPKPPGWQTQALLDSATWKQCAVKPPWGDSLLERH